MNTDEINSLSEEDILKYYEDIVEQGESVSGHYLYLECKRGSKLVKSFNNYQGYWGCSRANVVEPLFNSECKPLNACALYCTGRDVGYGSTFSASTYGDDVNNC